uniref:Serine aminopeptidase S33 domain-containing protein n=1 Tax=Fibrocapsa japonica TaxID=94617 RepID=A0A7S2UYB6_9STRA|mmetsp:Transcript_20134/g.29116  ORF Transcript_20134/g.29116 Transcript_20134/m.29116 type:complete len:363 (+) Transcript_20134:67-1155(+)
MEEATDISLNAPQSGFSFVNNRNQKIHVRHYLPESPNKVRGVVLWIHGYGGHINDPKGTTLGESMSKKGLAIITMDLHGHGYSEGERAYLEDWNHFVDDELQFLEMVCLPPGSRACKNKEGSSSDEDPPTTTTAASQLDSGENLGIPADFLEKLQSPEIPFFLAGESLGGGLAVLMATQMSGHAHLASRFKGFAVIAPAVVGKPPPYPVVWLLQHLVLPFFPKTLVPQMIEPVNDPNLLWKSPEIIKRNTEQDTWGQPGALAWGHNMRFATGFSLIRMTEHIRSILPEVTCPFYIVHDPDDGVCEFSGSQMLFDLAKTDATKWARAKVLDPFTGSLHDILWNETEEAISRISSWCLEALDAA